jgi:mono/diheme cytochrome c family protein
VTDPPPRRRIPAVRTLLKWSGLGVAALLIVAQAVPYGRSHDNPPVIQEPAWDSAATRAQVVKSCFACHSNETEWPWYSNIAPMSWLIQKDVDGGRRELNFSEWNRQQDGTDAAEVVRDGEMPMWQYTILHPGAKLSDAEKEKLAQGLEATFGVRSGRDRRDRDE